MDQDQLQAPGRNFRILSIAAVEPETDCVTSYWLASPDGAPLPAPAGGQYIPVAVNVPDHGVLRRSYTISAFEAGRYRLSIKREAAPGRPPGVVSNHIHDTWVAGGRVQAGLPRGDFVLDPTSRHPVVMLAAGIGITPLLAMLRDLAVRDPDRRVLLLMGMRNHRNHPFRLEVANLIRRMPNMTVHVRYSEQDDGAINGLSAGTSGRIDAAFLRNVMLAEDADVYLCGPGTFMYAMDQALAALGVPDERVRFEAFGPAVIERRRRRRSGTAPGIGPLVNFTKSNLSAPFDLRALNLLEFAEDLGLNPQFSCRSGTCGACATRRISGTIRYVAEPTAVVWSDEVLICCAVPDGSVTLDL